jgi:hypothetical protein
MEVRSLALLGYIRTVREEWLLFGQKWNIAGNPWRIYELAPLELFACFATDRLCYSLSDTVGKP